MSIESSTKVLLDYIEGLQFPVIFAETGFPLCVKSNTVIADGDAADYLTGAALVGSKAVGFFQTQPHVSITRNLRSACIFITLKSPQKITIPTFFCKTPADMPVVLPAALKVSTDFGLPVTVVLSPDCIYNYSEIKMPADMPDKLSPYLSEGMIKNGWGVKEGMTQTELVQTKLKDAHTAVDEFFTEKGVDTTLSAEISFIARSGTFPKAIFPGETVKGSKTVSTTMEEKEFLMVYMPESAIKTDIASPKQLLELLLCPGCPVASIFTAGIPKEKLVFTSLNCEGIKNAYNINRCTFAEYKGVVAKGLNLETIFIGNISEIAPIDLKSIAGTIIGLADIDLKTELLPIKHPRKTNTTKSQLFPYSCGNIKKYPKIKFNTKKCSCSNKGLEPICIERSFCAAILRKDAVISIDKNLCTNCGRCISVCPHSALS